MIIFKDIVRKEAGTFGACAVRACIRPLPGNGLDEAFGLAVGLGAIGAGELVDDAKAGAGCGKGVGAVADAPIGEDALDPHLMEGEEADGLLQGRDHPGDFFVRKNAGVSEPGAVIDGHVECFDAGTLAAVGPVAGTPNARAQETSEFLDVEMKQFAGVFPFVALDGWRGRIKCTEPVQAMTTQDA